MSLRYVMLMIKDVPKAAAFYSEGLGLPILRLSDGWAELRIEAKRCLGM